MSSAKDRKRAALRARFEREVSLRLEQAQRRRQRQIWSASIGGAAVVVALLAWLIIANVGGSPKPIATAAAGKTTSCVYTPYPDTSASPVPGANGSPAAVPTVNTSDLVKTGLPPMEKIPASGTRTMTLNTSLGKIDVSLDLTNAPCAANSLAYLASQNFYNNTKCSGFVTGSTADQPNPALMLCGSPNNKFDGGPTYSYATENLPTDKQPDYSAGDVAMYNQGQGADGSPGTNGSTFMIFYEDTPGQIDPTSGSYEAALPANFTIVGHVTSGLNLVTTAAGTAGSPDSTGLSQSKTPVTISNVTMGPLPTGLATPTGATTVAPAAATPSATASPSPSK